MLPRMLRGKMLIWSEFLFFKWVKVVEALFEGSRSGYRTACRSLNLKPYIRPPSVTWQ